VIAPPLFPAHCELHVLRLRFRSAYLSSESRFMHSDMFARLRAAQNFVWSGCLDANRARAGFLVDWAI
jgi:hypothetical protein